MFGSHRIPQVPIVDILSKAGIPTRSFKSSESCIPKMVTDRHNHRGPLPSLLLSKFQNPGGEAQATAKHKTGGLPHAEKYYFQIKQGKKKVELRAASDYWSKRVSGASQVVFRLGTLALFIKFWMAFRRVS